MCNDKNFITRRANWINQTKCEWNRKLSFSLSLSPSTKWHTHRHTKLYIQKTCTLNQRKSRSPTQTRSRTHTHTHAYSFVCISSFFVKRNEMSKHRCIAVDHTHMVNKQLYKLFNLFCLLLLLLNLCLPFLSPWTHKTYTVIHKLNWTHRNRLHWVTISVRITITIW